MCVYVCVCVCVCVCVRLGTYVHQAHHWLGLQQSKFLQPAFVLNVLNFVARVCYDRDGGVVVASFYLPVTLTREKAMIPNPRPGGSAAAEAGAADDTDGWTARWDYEQLIALQVTCPCRQTV